MINRNHVPHAAELRGKIATLVERLELFYDTAAFGNDTDVAECREILHDARDILGRPVPLCATHVHEAPYECACQSPIDTRIVEAGCLLCASDDTHCPICGVEYVVMQGHG